MIRILSDDFDRLKGRLRGVDRKVATAIRKRIRQPAQELSKTVPVEGADPMPQGGGIRDRLMAEGRSRVVLDGLGIRLALSNSGASLPAINRGILRHPVFGNKDIWRTTDVPAGSYDAAFEAGADPVRASLEKVLDDVAKEL